MWYYPPNTYCIYQYCQEKSVICLIACKRTKKHKPVNSKKEKSKMKRKILTVLLFILFALPIPVALLGFGMCFLWLLSAFMRGCTLIEAFMAILGILLGASYIFTYVFALLKTRAEHKISLKTFLPLFHCILALLFLFSLKPADRYISSAKEYFGFAKKESIWLFMNRTHTADLWATARIV